MPFFTSLSGVVVFCFSQNSLVKIPELQANMFQLATEMEKAGLVEEVVADGLALADVRPLSDDFCFRPPFRTPFYSSVNPSTIPFCFFCSVQKPQSEFIYK